MHHLQDHMQRGSHDPCWMAWDTKLEVHVLLPPFISRAAFSTFDPNPLGIFTRNFLEFYKIAPHCATFKWLGVFTFAA